jgi:hypothetical protein
MNRELILMRIDQIIRESGLQNYYYDRSRQRILLNGQDITDALISVYAHQSIKYSGMVI